jgi:hypothetical protein
MLRAMLSGRLFRTVAASSLYRLSRSDDGPIFLKKMMAHGLGSKSPAAHGLMRFPLEEAFPRSNLPINTQPHRTTNTEQWLCCTILVETLPRRNRAIAPNPFAPVTIRSALFLDAVLSTSSAGFPRRTIPSTT